MFRNLFIGCWILASVNYCYSQSLYELKFTDKNKVQYTGLMVYFNESKAYMRVSYSINNVYNVVNVEYSSVAGKLGDTLNYFFMKGRNPVFITDHKPDAKYNPDFLIWTWGKNESNNKLPYTTDDSTFQAANMIQVDSWRQLKTNEISDTYLRYYFGSNEDQYFSLKKMCGLTEVKDPVVANNGITLHFIIVANTSIGDIGKSCSTDKDRLEFEFSSIADALQIGFKKYEIYGTNFNKNNVNTLLNSVTVNPNDIVIFIYRGHGFRWSDQKDSWPMLDLRTSFYTPINDNSSINLGSVYTSLVAKGARLNIILGDCCNSDVGISKMAANNFLNPQSDNKPDVSKLKRLFISAKGNILSTAASPGEVSWANDYGGFFTVSFLQAMKEQISYLNYGSPDWKELILYTIKLARDKTSQNQCLDCSAQDGIYYTGVNY
ncbi:MAG: hypothetical protein C5B52_02975 [Bacteroidetes bacterium]|nr:MAG: hypothetical protein C5B52_02975 [Bacteroidota bacterium]